MSTHDRHVIAADGTRVAYGVCGSGPALVLTNGITTSAYFWREFVPEWSTRFTVVTWDFKGHGASEPARTPGGVTMPALADDLRRILDDLGIDRAILVGFSMGSQVILEAYRRYPERIRALIPILGPYERLFDTALGPLGKLIGGLLRHTPRPLLTPIFRGFHGVMRLPGSVALGRGLRLYGSGAAPAQIRLFVDHFGVIDPPTIRAMAVAAGEHSARDLLPEIQVPVLIVAGARDVFAPAARVGESMHRQIAGAELLYLPAGTHTSLFEHPREIGAAVAAFLGRLP
jgi:pimeloyl-ACP methyl ester carboxylesterase